jgi:hypothetical protein
MGRQDFQDHLPEVFPDPGASPKTTDCGSKSKSQSQSPSNYDNGIEPSIADVNLTPTAVVTGANPASAMERRRPMRRGGNNSRDSIFERDDAQASGASNGPTIGDILNHYLQQRSAAPKRAMSPKTSRGYD